MPALSGCLGARLLGGSVGARLLLLVASLHAGLAFLAAVVESAEPPVERDQSVAVVHLEIFVVEVVDVGVAIDGRVLAQLDLVEADMAGDGAEAGIMQLIKRQDRIGRNDE